MKRSGTPPVRSEAEDPGPKGRLWLGEDEPRRAQRGGSLAQRATLCASTLIGEFFVIGFAG
ncbi:hypothetical protein ACWCP7_13900, partial [Streptomyces goshikiensis]